MAKTGELDRLSAWRAALEAERQYRSDSLDPTAANDVRSRLLAALELMAERARADPNFIEPTAEQRRQGRAAIEAKLHRRGYLQG